MKSSILVEVTLPANVNAKDGWWIATCPALDVCTQGPTREGARVNLKDAVVFFVESCLERGTLRDVLGNLHEARSTDDE